MPSASDAHLPEGYRETQRWVERAIQRCPSPATTQFLQMISARITARLREIDNAGGMCD